MHTSSFLGFVARQIRNQFQRLAAGAVVRSTGVALRQIFSAGCENLKELGDRPATSRPLRYELCEARQVLSGYPVASGGTGGGFDFQEEIEIPVWVDGNFEFGDLSAQFPFGKENTFKLESNPSATKTIYLDFDGHHSVNNWWGHDIVFPAFDRDGNVNSFSDAELSEIQKQFLHVVEDFLPFDINVTTRDPGVEALRKSGAGDERWGVRAVNTQYTNGFGNGTGGIAHLNSFDANIDDPVFTFNKGVNAGGMTNSHEVGHALGLRHDGLGGSTYHPGTGSGPTGWGPIMGAPFGKNLVQWSIGDYTDSTNTEDDLAIITRARNGFGFRPDDHGNSLGSATPLDVSNVVEVSSWGIIERNTDVDYFSFASGPGNISIQIDALANNASLDVEARLYNASGALLATSNPANELNASFDLSVTGGTYFIRVDGVGKAGVYSDYGSLGYYEISGIVVDPVNDLPTLDPIDDIILHEDADEQIVLLTGISAGPNEVQPIRVTATSSNTLLIPVPSITYSSPDPNGTLRFQPNPDQNGVSVITVTVEDGGLDLDLSTKGDNATITRTFQVTVLPVNDPPTLDALDDVELSEDASEQLIDLSGITDGDEGLQPLAVTATSSNTNLIPTPTIQYTSPETIGQLTFQPAADQAGLATIFVTVEDGGNDNDLSTKADNLTFTQSFVVRVNAVNDEPTLDGIADQNLLEDENRTLVLSGITAGGGETQPLNLWATSNNPTLMQNPAVDYVSDNTTGELHLVPEPNMTGTTVITVHVEDGGFDRNLDTKVDNGIFTTTFVVTVDPVNDLPTLDPLGDLTLDEDAGSQVVSLTGISAGGDEDQPVRVTAMSSNPTLISNQAVTYNQGSTGFLTFASNPNRFGMSTITVTVEDGGFDQDLSTPDDNETFSRTFDVTVNPVNDMPRFQVDREIIVDRADNLSEIPISGVDSGPFESQPLRFWVSTDNPRFLTDLKVLYNDPDSVGKVTFDTQGQLGRGLITLTLEDGGLDNNLFTRGDNGITTKTIDVSVTEKTATYASTDRTVYGLVSGTYGGTYWQTGSSQTLTEVGFGSDRSRLDHHWRFVQLAPQVSMEFHVYASHDAANEQFRFEYRVDGTSTWKELVTTTQTGGRKYFAKVVDEDLADGGSIWVRVRDTDRGSNDQDLASLKIHKMYVRSQGMTEVQPAVNVFVFDGHAGEQDNNKAQIRFQLADRIRLDHDLQVYYQVGGTASNGDYREVLSGVKTIRAGNLMARLLVTPREDGLLEGNESLTIKVLADPAYRISGSPLAMVTIKDNDRITYEASAEASYQGSHRVHYPQSQFNDQYNEVISERRYGNRTMMNHQWRFDTAGEVHFTVRGKMDVASNPFVDDFVVSYSTDQANWQTLGVLQYGESLNLNRDISVAPGTQHVWIRLLDRYRGEHDTHAARVAVSYLQLVKPEVASASFAALVPAAMNAESLNSNPLTPRMLASQPLAMASPVEPVLEYLDSTLSGQQDTDLDDQSESDDEFPHFYECVSLPEHNLAILGYFEP